MLFWKRERQVQQSIEDYLQAAGDCVAAFQAGLDAYFTDGLCERFQQYVEQTHTLEHKADQQRREIEAKMYGKALIPESRGDILGMLEALDLIPNQCESVLYQIWTQRMEVPSQFADQFKQLIKVNAESWQLVAEAMRSLFGGASGIAEGAQMVTDKESQSDEIERELVTAVFEADLDKADKILLKELVLQIGSVSDRSENAADRLRNIAVKRQS